MICFDCILRPNAKFSLYIYFKYISFDWVVFYGISNIVGYLMPNSYESSYIWASLNKYTQETLVSFEVISSGCNALVVPFQQLLNGPIEVLLCH